MTTQNYINEKKEFVDGLKAKLSVKKIEHENIVNELDSKFGIDANSIKDIPSMIEKETKDVDELITKMDELESEIEQDIKKYE